MNALFSDLDNTILFSDRKLDRYHISKKEFISVDAFTGLDNRVYNSYIHKDILKYITSDKCLFVPVTARSIRRYRDIKVLADNIRYAITSCGGYVLINNNIDTEYREMLNIDTEELEYISNSLYGKLVDNSYIKTDYIDYNIIRRIKDKYNIQRDDDSIIIAPKNVSKESAVKYILAKYNIDKIMYCGDTELDKNLLKIANYSMVPDNSILSIEPEKNYIIYNTFSKDITDIYDKFVGRL